MLGKRRRIDTHRATGDDNQLPKYARDYLEEVANANSITPADFVQDVTALLTRAGVFSQGILLFRGLFVADPGETYSSAAGVREFISTAAAASAAAASRR